MNTAEKHNKTKLTTNLEDLRCLWADWSNAQRLEVIKSLIWTAPDQYDFKIKLLETIDKMDLD